MGVDNYSSFDMVIILFSIIYKLICSDRDVNKSHLKLTGEMTMDVVYKLYALIFELYLTH